MSKLPTPFAGKPLQLADAELLAGHLKAVADPVRLQMLAMLTADEMTTRDMTAALGRIGQPTVSHHLRILVEAGLVTRRRESVFVWHALVEPGLDALAAALNPGRRR